MSEQKPRKNEARDVGALLELVRELALELHPRRARSLKVALDSSLDRDLGFDSLSRVELLLRVQRRFQVSLPEGLFASAETPADLWQALGAGAAGLKPPETRQLPGLGVLDSAPSEVATLSDMLHWHVTRHPDRPHVYLYEEGDEARTLTYAQLARGAGAIAVGLQAGGLLPGQAVCLMLPTGADYLYSFFGILLAGGVPVPIYPPTRPAQIEDHLRRHFHILDNAETVLLITVPEARRVARLLKAHVGALRGVTTPAELRAAEGVLQQPTVDANDVAFLQYTSGSTGQPKGVILTHANLLANIRAMGEAVQASSADVFVSWLPLYHDMGLIGAWLSSVYFGLPLALMSPLAFLTRPSRWLWAIHRHRGTLTAAPNFAYELCCSKIEAHEVEGLDLGSVRMAFNGAEPVSPGTLRRFAERYASYGLRPNALAPVYGLAEVAVGLAFPPLERGPLIDRIQRAPFEASGRAIPADASDQQPLEFVACGQPLPGYQIRIVDLRGVELPDRVEGRLEFQGPSATSGYQRNAQATASLFDGDWLDSGDLAYVAGGDVFLTRRVKDVIIRGGRNIYPYEVEEAVGDIVGIRKGCVAVFASPDPSSGTERVIVVAETRETDRTARERLHSEAMRVATDLLEMPPDEVVIAPPHSVLKTSSGKIRRAAVRERFETGQLGEQAVPVWRQVARLLVSAWRSRARLHVRWLAQRGYALWAYLLFGVITPSVWLLVVLLPRPRWRFSVARQGARLLLWSARVPLEVSGAERVQQQPCVAVSNHASYLDGLVLVAALPGQFAFVAKGELAEQFVAGRFLRGIGAVFVERFATQRSVADFQQAAETAGGGSTLLFFPEGTFTRMPGLRPFYMGAFSVAAELGLPVVPITIVGTRSVLRDESWLPRRGPVGVVVGEPIQPQGNDWNAALALRDAARAQILEHLGEPDLER